MKIEVERFDKLSKVRQRTLHDIFKKSFSANWAAATQFPTDSVYMIIDDNRVRGFCMVHDTAPYLIEQCPKNAQFYVYNLCVDPQHRKRGLGRALLAHLKTVYPAICSHMQMTDKYHKWFMSCGWSPVAKWRETYVTYVWRKDAPIAQQKIDTRMRLEHYDPDENVIYLS